MPNSQFKSSNMKCLIFPSASASRSAGGSHMGAGSHHHHQPMQMLAGTASGVDKQGDEIMWEAPQLVRPHPRGGAAGVQHRRNNSLSRIMDNPMDLAAAGIVVAPTTNIIMHQPMSCNEYQSDFRDDLHLSAFEAPRVPLRRPISASPSTRGKPSGPRNRANPVSPLIRQQTYQANEMSDDVAAAVAMATAAAVNPAQIVTLDNFQYQYPVGAKTKHDSSCELEHQMESLSNFGDNLSVKSKDKRRNHSGGKMRRSSKSRHNGGHVSSSKRSSSGTGGRHNSGVSNSGLHRSQRRLGGSMSSVSTRSHRSKRRDRASSRSFDRRHCRKVPLANFTALSSPISPQSNDGEKPDPVCDCPCAEKLAELEQKLESFRIAVLEEMQYSLEYHNSRWSKLDKRYGKELKNLDELFSYRLEAERNDCFQRLQSKAAKERTAFALELTNTEKRLKSKIATCLSGNAAGQYSMGYEQKPPRVALVRRLSLPDMGGGGLNTRAMGQQMMGEEDIVCVSTTPQGNENADTKLSNDRTAGSSEGGSFARDSGIFDASQSSTASNHNCSSSDVSSPLGSSWQYFSLAASEKRPRSMHRSNQTIHADSFNVQSPHHFSYHNNASKSNMSVTDSEVENELNLKNVPVLKCLPSERLRNEEKNAKPRSCTPRSSTQNDFCNFSLEMETSAGNVYQNYPEKHDRRAVTSPTAEHPNLGKQSYNIPVSVGTLVSSPVRYPITHHNYRAVQYNAPSQSGYNRRESEPAASLSSLGASPITTVGIGVAAGGHISVSAMGNNSAFQGEKMSPATLRRPVKEKRSLGQQSLK